MVEVSVAFEVWKRLVARQMSEEDSLSSVIERLLEQPSEKLREQSSPMPSGGVTYQNVHLPNGTQFRRTYKGILYRGKIANDKWQDENGNSFNSPSEAAFNVTGSGVNGWTFWEVLLPNAEKWVSLSSLRHQL